MIDATDQKLFLNLSVIGPLSATGLNPFVAAAAASAAEQDLGVGPWKAGDRVLHVSKAAEQAGLAYQARVDANGHLQVKFINPTAAPITPTALELYKIVVGR